MTAKESSINKGINYGIPLGMHRSVENPYRPVLHPVKDASLTGCRTGYIDCSTERCIPSGMLFALTAVRQAIDEMPENKSIINTFIY
jgi:hypothetical protein